MKAYYNLHYPQPMFLFLFCFQATVAHAFSFYRLKKTNPCILLNDLDLFYLLPAKECFILWILI